MAHFARLNDENVVVEVLVVSNSDILDENLVEQESLGVTFLTNLTGHSSWVQTSYNGTLRKNYAGIGFTYDLTKDAFIAPKPYTSWILNEQTCIWEAPVAYPQDEGSYVWNEDNLAWEISSL